MPQPSKEEIERLEKLYESLYNDERIERIMYIQQHRGSNTYFHVLKVTRTAYRIAKRCHRKIDFESLIMGAILHDYFLYDWRVNREKKKGHGKNHPIIACANAIRDFAINEKVQNIIISHMWPINFFCFHNCIEAHIISLADKHVSFREAICSKKYKEKHLQKSLETLFKLEG